MTMREIVALCNRYGENTTLAEIRQSIQDKRKHICPKCKGTGSIIIEYNGYSSGFPDSSWAYVPYAPADEAKYYQTTIDDDWDDVNYFER